MSAVRVCYGHLVVAMILSNAQKRDDLLVNMHLYDCTCLQASLPTWLLSWYSKVPRLYEL